jgi:tetratricopeptide (TPR) repeat protein
VLALGGREEDAIAGLRDTIRVLPDSGLAHWWLGWVADSLNEVTPARDAFEHAAASGVLAGLGRVYASIGRLAWVSADFAGTLDALDRRVRLAPNDPSAHLQLGSAYLEQDRIDDAFDELVLAVLLEPGNAEAHAAIGRIHLDAGRHGEAVAALRHALGLNPDDHAARYALATALRQAGDVAGAARELDVFERAQRQSLTERRRDIAVNVLKEEANLRTAEGGHDRAAALWRQVVEREPGRPANHTGLAAALVASGRIDAAIEQYEIAATLGAEPGVYHQLAALYAAVGRLDDSARASARANVARPTAPVRQDPEP